MGWRYRKSISIGGTRINFSKSGVGFSYKFLGFGPRITHTAKGTTRTTWNIHGTGLSYITETGSRKKPSKKPSKKRMPVRQEKISKETEYYDTQTIQSHVDKNATAKDFLELKEFVESVRTKNNWIIVGIVVFSILGLCLWPFLLLLALMIYLKVKINDYGKVEVECPEMDSSSENEKLQLVKKAINSKRLRGIDKTVSNVDMKYSSGASSSIGFKSCTRVEKLAFPFAAKGSLIGIKIGAEKITFLQDFLLYEKGNDMIFLAYEDIQVELRASKFIEEGVIPADSRIIDYTYRYVNKDGSPDGRFVNNRRIPVCLYGDMIITSSNGLNIMVQFSDSSVFDEYYKENKSFGGAYQQKRVKF